MAHFIVYCFPLIPQFEGAIQDLFRDILDRKINVIVIGPLTEAEKDRRTTLHKLLMFLEDGKWLKKNQESGTENVEETNSDPVPVVAQDPNSQATSSSGERQSITSRTPAAPPFDVSLIVLTPTAIESESKTSHKFCEFIPAGYVCGSVSVLVCLCCLTWLHTETSCISVCL